MNIRFGGFFVYDTNNMQLSDKRVQEFKDIYKEEHGKELPDAEARKAAQGLLDLAELLCESATKDIARKRKLKENPDGFYLEDDTYSCLICHRSITGEEGWYDKWGPKCLLCQKAVESGAVPVYVCKDSDSWYAMWELKSEFKIVHQTAKKLMRQGELKARVVMTEEGAPYEYIFLKKENPRLISRYSPERKSYDRHRDKENKQQAREWKIEWRNKNKTRPLGSV